jgi:uncharacterized membrane protein
MRRFIRQPDVLHHYLIGVFLGEILKVKTALGALLIIVGTLVLIL